MSFMFHVFHVPAGKADALPNLSAERSPEEKGPHKTTERGQKGQAMKNKVFIFVRHLADETCLGP